MPPQEAEEGMRYIETMITQARQCLLAGPAASDAQRRNLASIVSERLPWAVERLQRQPMSTATARQAAEFFALVQDFVDTCLRSPLLGEKGPMRLDFTPLLYVLRVLVTAEPVSPRYLSGAEPAGVVPPHYFNRDHGKPLLREFFGRMIFVWPDDDRATRVNSDAIGWYIEILDAHEQLARQLLPEQPPQPMPAGSIATSQGTPLASDKWHRVFISGRPKSSGTRSENQGAGGAESEPQRLENKGHGAIGDEARSSGDSSTPLFVVTSESGMTATVDLSQFSIRWISFRGSSEEGNGRGQGGRVVGGDYRTERKGKSRERDKLPPGFGTGDATNESLAYGSADVGTRIDVWWSRYNAYYRATIERFDAASGTHKLVYDDGEIRDSDMSKRGFRIYSPPTPRQDATASHSAKKAAWTPSGLDEHAHATDGKKALYSSSLAPRPPAEFAPDASAYVIAAINRLGEAGGVAPLAHRLGVGRRAPFGEVLETFRIGKALRAHASARSMKEMYWVLKECAAVAMLSVPPESMRAATKAEIAECVSSVRDLALAGVRATQPPLELMQELEQLELAMAMKGFRCPSLERRLAGLMYICSLVTLAEQREAVTKLDALAIPGEGRKTAWVTAEAMERWLVEVGFLEELFGSSMHVELAKRSEPILTFLAKRNAVTTPQLDLLWSSTLGKHEAVVRVMRTVVVNLVPFLSPHKRLHLFSCVARTPFYKYTEQTLHLVYQFTVKALEAHRTTKSTAGKGSDDTAAASHAHASAGVSSHGHSQTAARPAGDDSSSGSKGALRRGQVLHCKEWEWEGYGYDLLWMFVQDSSKGHETDERRPGTGNVGSSSGGRGGKGRVSAELTSLAAGYLVSLLKEPEVAQELWPLVTRCVENVSKRRSVPSSLEVLRRAICTLPAHEAKSWFGGSRSKENSVPGALEALQRNHKLLPALLEELEDYHRSVASYYGRVTRSEDLHPSAIAATAAVPPAQRQRLSLEANYASSIPALGSDGRPYDGSTTGEKGRNGAPPTAPDSSTLPEVYRGDTGMLLAPPERAIEGGGGGGEGVTLGKGVDGTATPALASVSTHALSAQAQNVLNHGRVKAFGMTTRYSHLQHLQARLEFLMFALTNSSLGLAEVHVDLLWRVLIEEALTPEAADLALLWLRQACATVGDATFSTPFRGVGGGGGSSSISVGGSVGGDSVGGGKAGGGLGGTSWSTPGLLAVVGPNDDKSGAVGTSASFAGVIGDLPALPEASLTHLFEGKLQAVSFGCGDGGGSGGGGARPEVAVLFGLLFVHVNSRTKAIRPNAKTTSVFAGSSSSSSNSITNTSSSSSSGLGMISAAASAAVGSGVSVSSSALSQGTVGAGGGWVRHAMDLEGLDTLWGIVLNASGSRASAAASELIVELHRRLGPKLKPKAAKIGAGFVDTCLGHLRVAVSRMRKLRVELSATASTAAVAESQGGVGDGIGTVVGDDDAVLNDAAGGAGEDEEEGEEVQREEELGGEGQSGTRISSRSGDRHASVRSSSLPPEKVFQARKYSRARGGRRAASLEGRELSRVEEVERPQVGRDVGRQAPSPRVEMAALRRRVGRCIMLLAKFVDRSNEEESGSGSGSGGSTGGATQTAVVRVGVLERGSDRTPVLEIRFPGSSALSQLRSEVARRFRVPVHSLELFREVKRKGNIVIEKLVDDEASLGAAGLVVAAGAGAAGLSNIASSVSSATNAPHSDTAVAAAAAASSSSSSVSASSSSTAAAATVATVGATSAVATATSSSPSTSPAKATTGAIATGSTSVVGAASAMCVELLARIAGEIPLGSDSTQRTERKKETGGVDSGGSSSVASDARSGGVGGGDRCVTSYSQGNEPPPPLEPLPSSSSPFPPDLISMDDLRDGWLDDEIPSRWSSLTAPSDQREGVVTVLCRGRRARAPHSRGRGTQRKSVNTTLQQMVDEAMRQGGSGANAGPTDIPEVAETGLKRLSFRRPSVSSAGAGVGSKTLAWQQSLSSSSFALSTRRGRRSQRFFLAEEQGAGAAGGDVGAAAAGAESAVEDADAAEVCRSQSPPHSAVGGGWAGLERAELSLEVLLPDWRDLQAPPPPPLPPPLPHKAQMVLVELPAPPSSSSTSSSLFSISEGLGGSGGNGGGGTTTSSSSFGGSSGGGSSVGTITSRASFSSFLSSSQSGRSGGATSAVGGHGDLANGSASFGGGPAAGSVGMTLPAEVVGEPQHMDQLFDMLELDMGNGMGMDGGKSALRLELSAGARRVGARSNRREEDTSLRGPIAATGGSVMSVGVGDGASDADFTASLWHILQALPIDPTVVKDLRSLRKAETSWDALLDPRRCHRFVYALQVVDAFCTSRASLSGLKAVEALLNWSLCFCGLGGVDHLVYSLKVVRETVDFVNEKGGGRADASRLEAWTLSAALMGRILHRLLQLDAAYFHGCAPNERWSPAALFHSYSSSQQLQLLQQQQRPSQPASMTQQTKESSGHQESASTTQKPRYEGANDVDFAREGHPPKPPPSTAPSAFALGLESASEGILSDAIYLLLSLLRQSAPAKPLLSSVAHVLALVAGLAGGFLEGAMALERHPALGSLLRALCFRVPNTAVRRTACAVLYRASHWQALGRDASSITPDVEASASDASLGAPPEASSTTAIGVTATGVSNTTAAIVDDGDDDGDEELNTKSTSTSRNINFSRTNDLARILLAQLKADLARVQTVPFSRGGVTLGSGMGLSPVRCEVGFGNSMDNKGGKRDGASWDCCAGGSDSAPIQPLVVPRLHLVEVTSFAAGLVHVTLQQSATAAGNGAFAAAKPFPADAAGDSSDRKDVDAATGSSSGSVDVGDTEVVGGGESAGPNVDHEAAQAAAEWLLEFASRQLAAHEFTETFKSDATDDLLVSLLHALTVVVAGSSARKHRAESLFIRLAALSSSSAPQAVALALYADASTSTAISTSTPRWGLLRFLYEGCLFPSARAESSSADRQASDVSLTTPAATGEAEGAVAVAVSAAAVAESSLGPRCKKRETRRAAFTLLSTLCRGEEENLRQTFALLGGRDLVSRAAAKDVASLAAADSLNAYGDELASTPTLLMPAAGTVAAVDQAIENVDINIEEASGAESGEPWDYDPTSVLKKSGQYVGLQNQGATCYMNSLLQQLYHVPDFSLRLLGLTSDRAVTRGDGDNGNGRPPREEDEVLLQLQVLFASLRISQQKYYDTKPFCAVFRDYDGQPLRHAEQKDVNEFCIHLMHKLERSSKDAGKLIQRVFGGTLVYQIISRDCVHTSEKTEPFLVLTAEVQDKDSLEGSLQLLVAGEMLTGDNCYLCEKCGERVTAQRRCAIKQLPSTLIVHLKRFEFDLSTMSRHKLNHRCSFPMELDMSPWTLETLESIRRQDSRLSGGSDGALEAAAALAVASASAAATEHPRKSAILSQSTANESNELKSRVRLDLDPSMVASTSSGPVAQHVEESGEEGKEPEALAGNGDSRSPGSTRPGVGGGSVASVTSSSEDVGDDAATVANGIGDLGAEKFSAWSFGAVNMNQTGYRLKGIVAHQGTADHGHFYSLIRTDGDKWLEFNDRRVIPYDPANIPRDCFGGAGAPQSGATDASVSAAGPHETNAYLLLYESTAGFFGDDDVEEGRHHRRNLEPSVVHPPSATSKDESSGDASTSRLQRPKESATSSDDVTNLAGKNARGIVASGAEAAAAVPSSSTVVNADDDGLGDDDAASEERGRGHSKNVLAGHATAVAGSQGEKGDLGSLEVRHAEGCDDGDGGDNHDLDIPAPTAPLVAAAPAEAALPVEASARDERFCGEGGGGGGRGNSSAFTAGAAEKPQALGTFGGKQGSFRVRMKSRRGDSMDWGMAWSSDFGSRSELPRGEVYMSAEVLDQVWTAEMAFLRDMYLLDADLFRFVWDLLQQPEAESPPTATLAVHAGTKIAVEMVAHARASSCVPPWCRRLSELVRVHQQAADNALSLLSTGRREGSKTGYLRELLVSCPRVSTRTAFERFVTDAFACADPDGEPAAATCRVLLGLLDEESPGSVRSASPGGLTHVAAAIAAAATAAAAAAAAIVAKAPRGGESHRSILIAGRAVPRLLGCLMARRMHETSVAAVSGTPSAAIQLYRIGGFASVVRAVGRLLLAGAGAVEEALGGPEGVAAVTDNQFLLAALRACPDEVGNLLAHLVWRGSRKGSQGGDEGRDKDEGNEFATGEGAGLCDDGRAAQEWISERALSVLLEIVVDARKASDAVGGGGVTAAAVAPAESTGPAAVDLGAGMGVLSRVLHLRDDAVQDRLEVVLGSLAASGGAANVAEGGGAAYLTGKLVASLFVHVPEARPVLSRMPLLLGSR